MNTEAKIAFLTLLIVSPLIAVIPILFLSGYIEKPEKEYIEGEITNKGISGDVYFFELNNTISFIVSLRDYLKFDVGDYIIIIFNAGRIYEIKEVIFND